MLAEALAWLFTPTSATARRLGHLSESIAIAARHRRCQQAWAPHLAASRQALLDSARSAPSHRIALVLGSGHLLDVPLAELAGLFESVWLVDIVHPRTARRAARQFTNVRLIEHDVTESLNRLPADPPVPTRFLDEPAIDWVASVNLLSQLDLGDMRNTPTGDALMANHLVWLSRFKASVCLLTDLEQHRLDDQGNHIEFRDLRPLVVDWTINSQWRWDIAPAGELSRGETAHHLVSALTRAHQRSQISRLG
jgi:hypothetical protein